MDPVKIAKGIIYVTYWRSRQRLHLLRLGLLALLWRTFIGPIYRRQRKFDITSIRFPPSQVSSTRLAIVAAYPEDGPSYAVSLARLLRGFVDHYVQPCVVLNRQPTAEVEVVLSEYRCIVMERINTGRDIGAFHAAFGWLVGSGRLTELDRLFMVNDTVHWTSNSNEIVESALEGDWCAMFVSLNVKAHAQSFFLSFSRNVLENSRFRRFWRTYVPLNSRPWAINEGEIKLSTTLISEGFRCSPYVTPGRVRSSLERLINDPSLVDVLEELEVGNDGGIEPPSVHVGRFMLDRSKLKRAAELKKIDDHGSELLLENTRGQLDVIANYVNAQGPHRIGLHLALLLGVPIKNDIYKIYPLGTVERVLRRCDPTNADDVYLRLMSRAMRFMLGTYQSRRDRMLMEK